MDLVYKIALIACFLGITISILDIITPSEKLNKQLRYIFSLVFIISIATPLMKSGFDFNVNPAIDVKDLKVYKDINEEYDNCILNSVGDNIKKTVNDILTFNKISAKEIFITVNKSKDNCISINEVKIVLAVQDEKNISMVRNLIKKELPYTEIIIEIAEEEND